MKINEIIKLSDAFAAEVNVLRDYAYRNQESNEEKIKGYLPNKSSRDILKSILLSCPESTDKKLHLITASYGTGKSYLLLMIANLMANQSKESIKTLFEKIRDKENYYKDKLTSTLDNHIENSDPFLIVIPEYGDPDFNHALLEGLKFALISNNIDYIPKTNYEDSIKTISHWRVKTPHNYQLLKEQLNNSTIEKFVEQLQAYNPSTYKEFKQYYYEINGSPYAEAHTSAYPVFADTAKEIRKHGFRGIVIIYDEFGEMLGKLINSSMSATGNSVQDFLENVKSKTENSNIMFISASHQDPQSLKANKEKELNKVIGRFEKHQLIVSEAEGEEIIGAIFIKENNEAFEKIYSHSLFGEHLDTIENFNLYPDKDSSWIQNKILRNLYPLHPLTSFILPRISSEFAQNTRSMFNFLSPSETKEGAFKYFLNSTEVITNSNVNLFTPDMLLQFFQKNIQEDKEGRVQSLYDAYRTGIGKVLDSHHQSIMKNLFILLVVNSAYIRPTRETLFWAMNWEESRRKEFYNLLDDLTTALEYLELNPIDKTYHFPDFGTAPLSKLIDEEAKKLENFSLAQFLNVWESLLPLEKYPFRDHNNRFGCNRQLWTEVVEDSGRLISNIKELKEYYNFTQVYFANGYLFYLIGSSEDEVEVLKNIIIQDNEILPYIVYATPTNLPQFDSIKKDTLQFKAIESTAARPDVMQNPARSKSINEQLVSAKRNLEEKLKNLYDPSNWKWNYQQEKDVDLLSKPKFSNWINSKASLLFQDTPTIKDEALWFIEGNRGGKDRKQALDELFNAQKGRIPLRDDSDRAPADKRIIRNFFANIGLTTDLKRDKNVQYGEIKMPDQESQVYKAWKLIDSKLKSGTYINPITIITPLLQAPFGLSEHIIKFLLTSYIRYDIERMVIAVGKNKVIQNISLDLIDNMMNKPSEYSIRKIEMSGPEFRYLGQLKSLFDKQDVNSWIELAQKFIGLTSFLTPLYKGIIRDSNDTELQNFYKSLDLLKTEFSSGTDKEKVSQEFFQEHLPSSLLNMDRTFMDDAAQVSKLISKLDAFKKYPIEKEAERKMEAIQALAVDVFKKNIVTKSEITQVVQEWFRNLPTPNQNGKFTNDIIKNWLLEVKLATTNDPFELYLNQLNEKPFKDWDDFSYEKFNFISRFKEYKKTVEEYTKSPLEVLQIIARDVFEKSSTECNSEDMFDSFFKDWWNRLPKLSKSFQYSNETNFLLSQITISSAVKARYLETIPQVWRENQFLPIHIPKEWETWSNSNTYTVAEKYKICIDEVNNWEPPISENELFNACGKLFVNGEIKTASELFVVVKKWHEALPERTKKTNWGEINENAAIFLNALDEGSKLESFIMEKAPTLWKLPSLKQWDQSTLQNYLTKFRTLKIRVEDYKRPLQEIVERIEEKYDEKSNNPETFCYTLNGKIKDSDAYKNRISHELLNEPIATILYQSSQIGSLNISTMVASVADALNIDKDWHLWNEKDEKIFVSGLKKAIDTVVKWKFPEAEKLKKAKSKVKAAITNLQSELELDDNQIRKVLNDILDGK